MGKNIILFTLLAFSLSYMFYCGCAVVEKAHFNLPLLIVSVIYYCVFCYANRRYGECKN